MTLNLRPMTEEEFAARRARRVESFADDLLRAGLIEPERARPHAEEQYARLLPDGTRTPGHLLLVAEAGSDVVGWIWISLPGSSSRMDSAWIYDVEVADSQRGRGYGRALMELAERELSERGIEKVGLNVFGDNTVAIRLYESLGYRVTAQQMSKRVT